MSSYDLKATFFPAPTLAGHFSLITIVLKINDKMSMNPKRWCCKSAALNMSANLENCSDHRTGKGQFSFQSQRKGMPKNGKTTWQLHSYYTLAKQCSKLSKLGLNSMWTKNFQMFKLDLEKAEEPEMKLPTSTGSYRTVLWILWERERVGWLGRMALKHV